MADARHRNDSPDQNEKPPRRARLPGFIAEEEIGLGDVITRAASYLGIQPCAGCARRAAALNGWMGFTGRKQE